jgi:hypothetical protein
MAISTFINPKITTRDQLKDRVLKRMGWPLITVELTDEQIDLAIDMSIEVYSKWASFPQQYLIINLKEYVQGEGLDLSKYGDITSVIDFNNSSGYLNNGSMNDCLFNFPNYMFASGMYPYFGTGGYGGWTTYAASIEFLKTSARMMGGMMWDYDYISKKLRLAPEPHYTTDKMALLTCEVIPPEEYFYGNEYVQRLTIAHCKQLLGTIRGKFQNLSLLGGGSVDTSIGQEGKEELENLIKEISISESAGHGFFIG